MKTISRRLYLSGLACFVFAAFFPVVPEQVTEKWDRVVQWDWGYQAQLWIALEPAATAYELGTLTPRDFEADSSDQAMDGFKNWQSNQLHRIAYSLPSACGWFFIVSTLFFIRLLKRGPRPRLRLFLKFGGLLLLVSALLLALDYLHDATLWEGYFHFGLGAYLIVASYLLIGLSLLLPFTVVKSQESPDRSAS